MRQQKENEAEKEIAMVEVNSIREARDLAAECLSRSSTLGSGVDSADALQLTILSATSTQAIAKVLNLIRQEIDLIRVRLTEIAALLAHRGDDLEPPLAAARASLDEVATWIREHPELREVQFIDRTLS